VTNTGMKNEPNWVSNRYENNLIHFEDVIIFSILYTVDAVIDSWLNRDRCATAKQVVQRALLK
jgi:hypothetical protein